MSEDITPEAENVSEAAEGVTEVQPDELSDADLDTLIKNDPAIDEEPEDAEDLEAEQAEQPKKQEQQESQETGEVPVEDEAKVSERQQEKIRQLEARLQQQETFIQRRNSELGEAKSKLRDAVNLLKGKLDDTYLEKPSDGIKLQKQIETLENKIELIDEEAREINLQHATQKAVAKFVKPDEVSIEDMVGCLVEDGIDPAYIEQFKKNPFSLGSAATVHLAKRAQLTSQRDEARTIAMQLWQRLQDAEKKPSELVKKISTVARQKPSLNGGSGTGASKRSTPSNPALLSDKELDDLFKLKNSEE